MKKVLLIGNFWPYRGGSIRIFGLAKYLKDFGWEPIILTGPLNERPSNEFRYIETGYLCFLGKFGRIFGIDTGFDMGDQLKRKIDRRNQFSWFKIPLRFIYRRVIEVLAFPDEDKLWKGFAINAAEELIKNEKIDAMISVWPLTSHCVAKELKKRHNILWVADFPDLWSLNCDYPYNFIRKFFDRRFELKTLKTADILTTVSEPMEEKMRNLHKNKRVFTITHGFDEKKVNFPAIKLTEKFTITYTGLIYHKYRDPLKILFAAKDLIENGTIDVKDIEIRFYGPPDYTLEKNIIRNNFSPFARQYGVVSKEESLKRQWESQLLLFLNWDDKNEKGVFSGKIFEYLAARRPVFSTGGFKGDVIEKLLRETNIGAYTEGKEQIKKFLKDFYSEYKKNKSVRYEGNISEINKYSQREMARKFADILSEI